MSINNLFVGCEFASSSKYHDIVLIFLIVLLALITPWLAVLTMGVLARGIFNERIGRPLLAVAIISFISVFNGAKQLDGDLVWYINDYMKLSHMGLLDYLQAGGSSIRITEPLYYAFSFVISRMSDGNVFVFIIAVSCAIYYTYIYALERLLTRYGLRHWGAVVCIVFAVMAGITFTQSFQLIRQYIAGSILFLFFVFLVEGKNKKAMILLLLGTLVHNSFVVPAVILLGCRYLWNHLWVKKHYFFVLLALLTSGFLIGDYISSAISTTIFHAAAFKNDGDISMQVIILDVALFLISLSGLILIRKHPVFDVKSSAVAVMFLAFFGAFLFGIHDLTLFLLRFYFFVEWFRVIGIITLVWFMAYRVKSIFPILLLIPLSLLMVQLRVDKSPWDYGGGFVDHLVRPIWWSVDKLL